MALAGLGIGAYKAYDEYSNKPELEDKEDYINKRLTELRDLYAQEGKPLGDETNAAIIAQANKDYEDYVKENRTFFERTFNIVFNYFKFLGVIAGFFTYCININGMEKGSEFRMGPEE